MKCVLGSSIQDEKQLPPFQPLQLLLLEKPFPRQAISSPTRLPAPSRLTQVCLWAPGTFSLRSPPKPRDALQPWPYLTPLWQGAGMVTPASRCLRPSPLLLAVPGCLLGPLKGISPFCNPHGNWGALPKAPEKPSLATRGTAAPPSTQQPRPGTAVHTRLSQHLSPHPPHPNGPHSARWPSSWLSPPRNRQLQRSGSQGPFIHWCPQGLARGPRT